MGVSATIARPRKLKFRVTNEQKNAPPLCGGNTEASGALPLHFDLPPCVDALEVTLEAAAVELSENGGGPGARQRNSAAKGNEAG